MDRAHDVVSAVRLCGESVDYLVNQGSDIAESMGLKDLCGEEGTIQR